MFHVIKYAGFPDHGIKLGPFITQQEAEAAALQAARQFQSSGFDQEPGYWWGRNDGEVTVRFLVVAK